MSNKHELLTSEEVYSYEPDTKITEHLELYLTKNPDKKPGDIHVLDWGCGRGKAVLKFLEKGFSAYGVDIDRSVLQKGFPLFAERGYDPEKHLLHADDLSRFPNGYFQFIFSEQVFEHVENLEENIRRQSKLTAPGGAGCHVFPSSRMIRESHLNMPFVHWLPKNGVRKLSIFLMLLLSRKPQPAWPETEGLSFREEADIYYNYLNHKTFYRSNRTIKKLFEENGFEASYLIHGVDSLKRKFIPRFLLYNGFPDQQVRFITKRKEEQGITETGL